MENGRRKLILNWCPAHDDLKRSIEDCNQATDGYELRNDQGWTYLTFFPEGTSPGDILFDVDKFRKLALDNHYYLPREVIAQHNKVVLTAYSDSDPPISPLVGIFTLVTMFASLFNDPRRYPAHGIYGKFGGIYERAEKGRVLAIYSSKDDDLLMIYESLEKLISEIRVEGFRFVLGFSNGLSAIPRMLQGFDDPRHRRSGVKDFRITDPARFAMLLEQAMKDYEMYLFDQSLPTPANATVFIPPVIRNGWWSSRSDYGRMCSKGASTGIAS
jgi:hypothetical protein